MESGGASAQAWGHRGPESGANWSGRSPALNWVKAVKNRYRYLIRDWVCAVEREPPKSLALQLPLPAKKQLGHRFATLSKRKMRVRSAALDVVRPD